MFLGGISRFVANHIDVRTQLHLEFTDVPFLLYDLVSKSCSLVRLLPRLLQFAPLVASFVGQ